MNKANKHYHLKGEKLYDLVANGRIEPSQDYYKLVIEHKEAILFDVKLEGQAKIAELLSNKEHKLTMSQSRLSAIIKILEVL